MNEKQTDAKSAATREVYEAAMAIIKEKETCCVLPLHATTEEVAQVLHKSMLEVAYEFGRIDAYGVATCGRTLNGYYIENKKR